MSKYLTISMDDDNFDTIRCEGVFDCYSEAYDRMKESFLDTSEFGSGYIDGSEAYRVSPDETERIDWRVIFCES